MISFLMTLRRMLKGFIGAIKDKEFQVLLLFSILTLFSGMTFYSNVEGLSKLDALYFSMMTLSTVGSSDFTPQTDFGKIFTMVYMVAGIGIIIGFIIRLSAYIRGAEKH